MNCNQHVGNCTCPDIEERLASIGQANTNTAVKVCRKCSQHYARCRCPEPDFFIRIDGKELPMSALEDGTLTTLEQRAKSEPRAHIGVDADELPVVAEK